MGLEPTTTRITSCGDESVLAWGSVGLTGIFDHNRGQHSCGLQRGHSQRPGSPKRDKVRASPNPDKHPRSASPCTDGSTACHMIGLALRCIGSRVRTRIVSDVLVGGAGHLDLASYVAATGRQSHNCPCSATFSPRDSISIPESRKPPSTVFRITGSNMGTRSERFVVGWQSHSSTIRTWRLKELWAPSMSEIAIRPRNGTGQSDRLSRTPAFLKTITSHNIL